MYKWCLMAAKVCIFVETAKKKQKKVVILLTYYYLCDINNPTNI